MTRTSVLIADDHPLFRRGLRDVIDGSARFGVVAEVGDGEAAIEAIARLSPALAILDLTMPGKDGFAVLAWIADRQPATRAAIMTLHKSRTFVDRAIALGALGYLVKDDAEAEVTQCLELMLQDELFVSPSAGTDEPPPPAAAASDDETSGVARLTPAQRRVLRHLSDYRTSKEIARLLDVSPKTIENHRANISATLGLRGINALLRFAVRTRSLL
ncbi:MAG: response regulator [Reyranellaceae bacterium]